MIYTVSEKVSIAETGLKYLLVMKGRERMSRVTAKTIETSHWIMWHMWPLQRMKFVTIIRLNLYVLNRLKKEVTALLQEMFSQGKDCPLNPFRMLQRRFGYVKVGELTYVQVFITTMYFIVNVSTRLYCWSYIFMYMNCLYITFFKIKIKLIFSLFFTCTKSIV